MALGLVTGGAFVDLLPIDVDEDADTAAMSSASSLLSPCGSSVIASHSSMEDKAALMLGMILLPVLLKLSTPLKLPPPPPPAAPPAAPPGESTLCSSIEFFVRKLSDLVLSVGLFIDDCRNELLRNDLRPILDLDESMLCMGFGEDWANISLKLERLLLSSAGWVKLAWTL